MKDFMLIVIAFSTLACMIGPKESSTPPSASDLSNTRGESVIHLAEATKGLRIGKLEVSSRAKVIVELENSSKEPVRLWKNSNSWGAARWRLLLIRNGHLDTFFQNPDQGFTVNFPAFDEIAGGAHIEHKLDLNGGNWCGLGHCSIYNESGFGGNVLTFEPNDIVIVIYNVPVTQEVRDNHVWYGAIATTTGVAANQSLKANRTDATRGNSQTNNNVRPLLPVERSMNALKIDKLEVSRSARINLGLQNISQERVNVWNDSNSWGAACWQVLRIRNGRVDTFFQNPDQDFTKNGPSFTEIAAGGHLEKSLDLNGGNWCGLGYCSRFDQRGFDGKTATFDSNDTIVVIYDVPVTQEARDNRVWYGVIAATGNVQ